MDLVQIANTHAGSNRQPMEFLKTLHYSPHTTSGNYKLKTVRIAVDEPPEMARDVQDGIFYSGETNSRLENLGFTDEIDRNRIALSYSERLLRKFFLPEGDYFKKVLDQYNFADAPSFVGVMEAITRKGLKRFNRMLERSGEVVLFTGSHYDHLVKRSHTTRNPLMKDVLESRIYLIDKFIWETNPEPNVLRLTYQ